MDDPNIWMLIAKALRNRRPPGGGSHVASGSGPYFDPGGGAPMPPPWVHPMPPESYPGAVTTPATPEEPIPAASSMPQGTQDHASSRAQQVVNDLTKTWMIRAGSQGRVHGPSFDRPKPKIVSGTPGPKPTTSTSTFQGIKTAGGFTSASKKMPK